MKVIIAPHDAHALRGDNGVPCDAYCKELNGYFLDFYSVEKCMLNLHFIFTKKRTSSINSFTPFLDRDLYKQRLEVFFKHYPSKNFDGRSWGELSEVILVSTPLLSSPS